MALSRRTFLRALVGGVLLVASGGWYVLSALVPERFRRAVPGGRFPGTIRSLRAKETRKRAPWAG